MPSRLFFSVSQTLSTHEYEYSYCCCTTSSMNREGSFVSSESTSAAAAVDEHTKTRQQRKASDPNSCYHEGSPSPLAPPPPTHNRVLASSLRPMKYSSEKRHMVVGTRYEVYLNAECDVILSQNLCFLLANLRQKGPSSFSF